MNRNVLRLICCRPAVDVQMGEVDEMQGRDASVCSRHSPTGRMGERERKKGREEELKGKKLK